MDPRTDKLIRRATMGATCTAAYLLLTADYGNDDNVLVPINRTIKSVEIAVKNFVFGSDKDAHDVEKGKPKV